VVLTALRSLVDAGQLDRQKLAEAIKKYEIDTAKPNPMTV
jgi:pyruvate dehydrogenase E1 component